MLIFIVGIQNGKMVNLMFGANAPRLMRLIVQELDKELKVIKGDRERSGVSTYIIFSLEISLCTN